MAAAAPVPLPPIYDQVKQRIHQLLSTHLNSLSPATNGLTLTELCREYEHRYNNEKLPYLELGYETLTRFLSSMSDVVRMDFTEWPAKCYLRAKINRQTPTHTNLSVNDPPSFSTGNNKRRFRTGSSVTYAEVKKNIILILKLSSQSDNGSPLTFTELCDRYSQRNNHQQLPYEQLGYPSLQALLETMWDSVRVDNRRCYLINNKDTTKKGQNLNKYHEDR